MQLHRVAASLDCSVERVCGYTVHDGSVYTDGGCSDYVTAFHFSGCLPKQIVQTNVLVGDIQYD